MSSSRFPGKVLAPFRGAPLILHVLNVVQKVLPRDALIVATSTESSDDPLTTYLEQLGVNVVRGSLKNVFDRFRLCVERFPCEWMLRISADSPLLHGRVLQKVVNYTDRDEYDLVTTIFPRTFPKGQNAELIRTSAFMAIDPSQLTRHDQEHVTPFYYRNPDRFQIVNIESGNPELTALDLSVDTIDDLGRLENIVSEYGEIGFWERLI